jgi:hypothetical protein
MILMVEEEKLDEITARFTTGACVFPALAVDVTGRITWQTQPSRWRVEELTDTGRTLLEIFATTPSL